MSKSRLLLAVLCIGVLGAPGMVGAATAIEPFTWDPEAQLEKVGTPRDPAERMAEMAALQRSLAGRQVDRGVRAEVVVNLSAAERKTVNDEPSHIGGKLQVGLDKAVGAGVDFGRGRNPGLGAARSDEGGLVWSAALRSPGATGVRAHITGLDLPEGAALYVYNKAGQAFGPYTGRGPLGDGELWTNTVFGEQLILQLQAPAGTRVPSLRVVELGVMGQRFLPPRYNPEGAFDSNDLERLATAKAFCTYNASCVVNAACQTSTAVNDAKDAVATMLFTSGGGQYICTGQLIADSVTSTVVPFFLTAHHCISSSGEASSLETYFDYQTTCSSPNCAQPYNNTGETVGATIKATGSSGDFTLMQLSSAPTTPDGVASYLGWSTTAVANTNNTALFRISHPSGAPQAYSTGVVDTSKTTCRTLPRGTFIYSRDTLGATEGGSSGSAVVNGSGQLVGQLYGACGFNLNDVCDASSNATVDGAFAAYFSSVQPFLQPGGGGTCSAAGALCTSNSQCCSNSCKGKPGAMKCK